MESDILSNLALGFSTAVSPINLFYCFIGVLVGTLIGVLPGIGPVAAVAMLLPLTFNLDAVGAIMLVLGAIVALMSLKVGNGEKVTPFAWKPMIMLSVGFLVFGWGVDHIGFIPALFGLSVITAAAGQKFNVVEVLLMTVVLIAGAVGIFIYGIELPFPLFWWR